MRLLHRLESARPADELERRRSGQRVRARLLEGAAVLEDPDVAVADRFAERLLEVDAALHDRDLCAFGVGALAQERVCVVGVRVDEEQVEADRRRGQRDGDGGEHGQQQPRADVPKAAAPVHSIA